MRIKFQSLALRFSLQVDVFVNHPRYLRGSRFRVTAPWGRKWWKISSVHLTPQIRNQASILNIKPYLDPKGRQNDSPKHLKMSQEAIILHTFGVQATLTLNPKPYTLQTQAKLPRERALALVPGHDLEDNDGPGCLFVIPLLKWGVFRV